MEDSCKILDTRVDNFSKKEILEKVEFFLNENKFHQIATINPEFVLQAQKDVEFENILNNCDLNVADGFGIKLAFWRYGRHLKTRMAGANLTQEILKMADNKKLSMFLAANKDGLSGFEEIKSAILKIYPNLEIAGADLNKNAISYQIPDTKYQILFCNFGAPYQEKFIHSLKNAKDSKIKLAMGVGGSFDFLTGKIKRAPKIIRAAGFEWLWRFILEPKYRLKRIWNATVVFMIKIIFNIQENNEDGRKF